MSVYIIKSRPEQRGQFSFLINIISMIPGVKNWYVETMGENDLLNVEATEEIDEAQLHSLLNLYEIRMELSHD